MKNPQPFLQKTIEKILPENLNQMHLFFLDGIGLIFAGNNQ
jgi:hypothetical protein